MRHVDDGELHAYLDGESRASADERGRAVDEHLAECAECRARLEEARRVRERAQAILRAADPAGVAVPAYEQILARAARQRARSRTVRPAVALAWAASVAVAVTVGWYARTLIGRGPAASQLARSSPIEAAPPARPQPASPAKQLAEAGNRPAAEHVPAEKKEGRQVAAAAPETADAAKTRVLDAAAPVAPAPAPVAAMQAPEKRMAAPVLNEEGWTTASMAEAERRLGGPIARIPDLAILGHSVSGSGDATVVHTIQVLGPGVTLDLYQQRSTAVARERGAAAGVARPSVRALREEAIEPVSVDWEGFRVGAQARVPADSLRALLRKLRAP